MNYLKSKKMTKDIYYSIGDKNVEDLDCFEASFMFDALFYGSIYNLKCIHFDEGYIAGLKPILYTLRNELKKRDEELGVVKKYKDMRALLERTFDDKGFNALDCQLFERLYNKAREYLYNGTYKKSGHRVCGSYGNRFYKEKELYKIVSMAWKVVELNKKL